MKVRLFIGMLVFICADLFCGETKKSVKEILLENTFFYSYTLDCESIKFFEQDGELMFCSEDEDYESYSPENTKKIKKAYIYGNNVYVDDDKESYYYLEQEEYPFINYRYNLVFMKNGKKTGEHYITSAPEIGETVQYKGNVFEKIERYIITKSIYKMYESADEDGELYTSNHLYEDKWKDSNTYRIPAGLKIRIFGTFENKKNKEGKLGAWCLLCDSFKSDFQENEFAWIFVPYDEMEKNDDEKIKESLCRAAKGYENLFYDAMTEMNLPLVTEEEAERIKNKRWWDTDYFLPYDMYIFGYEKRVFDNINVNASKRISENLRLRENSSLKSKSIVTLKAGSVVKILELGQKDVIDGIYSLWVKVEVSDGMDKDGKALSKISGWCFAGYLN